MAFDRFKRWPAIARDYEDTVKRLLREGFDDLSDAERERTVEQIIQAAAVAAMALGAAPLPLLEMPVLAAMVRAIGKVYGVERTGRKVLLELAAALGGALALRQALRLVPFVGGMANASRIYGATWALGRAAQFHFARGKGASREEMREVFRDTMERKTHEQAARAEALGLEERLRTLERLRREGLITEDEYGRKRAELLGQL